MKMNVRLAWPLVSKMLRVKMSLEQASLAVVLIHHAIVSPKYINNQKIEGMTSNLPLIIISTSGTALNDVTQTISDFIVIKDPTSTTNVLANGTPRNYSGIAAIKISGSAVSPFYFISDHRRLSNPIIQLNWEIPKILLSIWTPKFSDFPLKMTLFYWDLVTPPKLDNI